MLNIYILYIYFSIPSRSSRDSCSILCLWYMCWTVLLAVFVWPQIHPDTRSERPGLWAGRWAEVLWRRCLLAFYISPPHAPLSHTGRVQSRDDNDSGDGGQEGWGQTRDAQWRHLAPYQLQSLCHAQNQNHLCLNSMFSACCWPFSLIKQTLIVLLNKIKIQD